jgi:hypothetical protein
MLRIKPPLALLLLISAAACALRAAQTSSDTRPPQSDTVKTNLESAGSIKILSADEMTRHDRDLEGESCPFLNRGFRIIPKPRIQSGFLDLSAARVSGVAQSPASALLAQ